MSRLIGPKVVGDGGDGQRPITKESYASWRRWNKLMVAIIILFMSLSGAALAVAIMSHNTAWHSESARPYVASGALDGSGPLAHYLDGTAAPLAMTLENDLSARVGKVYRIWSRTAQAHTVRISSGALISTWDSAGSTLATFGGAIGDGFVFEVISRNQCVLISVNNVVFS